MNIVVGCPIKNRAFVFPSWLEYVQAAFIEIGVRPQYVFEYGDSDDETLEMLQLFRYAPLDDVHEKYLQMEEQHDWIDERYIEMAEIRNNLLRKVRAIAPDYFLSLDSDILIAPGVLPNLLETIQTRDCEAVGGKLYMQSVGQFCPSYGIFQNQAGSFGRPDGEGVWPCDVIMAMKLMSPAAYNVDYVGHFQGEDVGWSHACRLARVKFYWDGRITSKHIMRPAMLDIIDERCGY